jgi:hypothetical protein
MIWIIILFTWAIVIAGSHLSMGQAWQGDKHWKIIAGISLIASVALYYFLGFPNLPDHPYWVIVKLLKTRDW